MTEELKDVMKEKVLKVCEKHTSVLSDETVEFAYDLVRAVVESTPNVIDDGVFTVLENQTKGRVKELVREQIDKIDGVEGNLE